MALTDPPIRKFMTAQPHSIHANETVKKAQDLMVLHRIRHLPVMNPIKTDEVFGIISERDINLICCIAEANPAKLLVKNVCHAHPYVVSPDTPLREAAEVMVSQRYDAAIVVQGAKLVGMFTTVDACRALASLLREREMETD